MSRKRLDKKVGQADCGISLDFSKDIPINVLMLPYFIGYIIKSALQITSVIRVSIVVDGRGTNRNGGINRNTTPYDGCDLCYPTSHHHIIIVMEICQFR